MMHQGDSQAATLHISDLTREKAEMVKSFIAGRRDSSRKVPEKPGSGEEEKRKLGQACGEDEREQPKRSGPRENPKRCATSSSQTQP
jgi:hypothetical protein